MGLQVLSGITIVPKGSHNLSRFPKWGTSEAFGGYIFSANVDIGFSQQPTEIRMSIILEAKDKNQISAVFDIKKEDLRCDAGNGQDENLFDINLNGIQFNDFILYNYEISITNNVKQLNVIFKDYSVILDKIYIGLLKRQGNKHIHTAISDIQFPVRCPDCSLNGSSFTQMGSVLRDIAFGSYVGMNGFVYDNFEVVPPVGNVYQRWESLFNLPSSTNKFDLNGGYLILGTEDATEEKCGDLAPVSYNFNQLLASLRYRGFNFGGKFPVQANDSDFIYKQNYIGTLREVLQQWCSDLGYDFYCEGKNFIGININEAIDISRITEITDPTTELGSNFALNTNNAIISYKENNTIANSYKQSVITANNKPRQTKTHTKSPKRYVGFTPLHPIDFNLPNRDTTTQRTDIFGNAYADFSWTNSFNILNQSKLHQLDGRTFNDVDSAIALSHYDSDLRDIYCQDRAIYGETLEIRQANFKALGIVPLIEITESDKISAIEAAFGSVGDEITNLCLDSRYFKVYIGYYYPKFKEEIVRWEQAAADAMYRYGALTRGTIQGLPYMPADLLQDVSPYAGLYGSYGTSTTRIKHNYEPSAEQYYDLYEAPFKDIILYSGLRSRNNYFPENLYIAELSNDWGTTHEHFQRELSLNLSDACVSEYAQNAAYTSIENNVEKRYQDWKLNIFTPQVISDLENFFQTYQSSLAKISDFTAIDRTVQSYYDLNYVQQNTCAKLHIIVLTDTRTHPNVYVNFTKRGKNFINPVVLQKYLQKEKEAIKRKALTKTPNTCDKTLLQEMCDSLLYQNSLIDFSDPRYACALQDEHNAFEEGFDISYLSSPNSRGLDIKIIKNPIRNTDTDNLQFLFRNSDVNGNFYYTDTILGNNSYQQKQANLTIIYPISVEPDEDIYYKGVLTSDIEIENRSPEVVEIFGEPPNSKRNICAGLKIINNTIPESNISPQLDPYSTQFLNYITVLTGPTEQILTTVSGYHNYIQRINGYEITGVQKTVDLTLAGTPDMFGTFSQFLNPSFGLQRLSINIDDGVTTSVSFGDRPPNLPKSEAILNVIGPRLR